MVHTRRTHLKGLLATAGLMSMATVVRAADADLIGTWSGRLVISSAVSLRLRLVISDNRTAKLISLDQGNSQISADTVSLDGLKLKLTFATIAAEFSGTLSDKTHIDGTFTQMGRPTPLKLHRGEIIEEVAAAISPPITLTLLQTLRTKAGTPAMGAAWQGSRVRGLLADGLRASDDTVVVTPDDQWHWGSITKSMTSTLVARLVESGALNWQTTVGAVLGDKVASMQAAYRDATFLHLLSHRSGLQANIEMSSLVTYARDPLPDARAERLKYAAEALTQTPVGPLGAQMLYSNNGYIVAGAMLEAITGSSWEDLMRAHVFAPLRLGSAGFGPPGKADALTQPVGHTIVDGKAFALRVKPGAPNDNPVALGPAGRVHMNLSDMMTYLAAHRDERADFLKGQSWLTLHTPPFGGNYALGWIVRPDGALWHNGSNTIWYGEILFDKKAGVVCTAVGNLGSPLNQDAVALALASARAAALA